MKHIKSTCLIMGHAPHQIFFFVYLCGYIENRLYKITSIIGLTYSYVYTLIIFISESKLYALSKQAHELQYL